MNAVSRPAPMPTAAAEAARVALRAAIAVAAEAAKRAVLAASVAERGNALADSAASALAAYEPLAGKIAAHHASVIRDGAGRAALPADLAAARLAKRDATDALADAVAAAALLAEEAAEAKAEAAAAADAVDVASIRVIQSDALELLARMREAEQAAALLRAALSGYCTIWTMARIRSASSHRGRRAVA